MRRNDPVLRAAADTLRARPLLSGGLICAIAGAVVLGLLPPLVLEGLVNDLAAGSPAGRGRVALYVALLVLAGACEAAKESLIIAFGQQVTHRLRSAMCAKLSRLEASYFDRNEPGFLTARLVGDVDTVEVLFTGGVVGLIADACSLVGILAVVFTCSVGLGVLLVVCAPLLFALTRRVQRRTLQAQLRHRQAVARANQHIPDTLQNIRTIRALGKETYMENRYGVFLEESCRAVEETNFCDAVYSPIVVTVSTWLVAVMMVLSAWGGAFQSLFGMSVGTAVAVIAYVGKVFEPLESIGMEIQNIQAAAAGIRRIRDFLGEGERTELPAVQEVPGAPAAELRGVDFGYEPDRPVLKGASLAVQTGETVTLAGRTGAGKSTVMKLLLGLYAPRRGRALLNGRDARAVPEGEKRALWGYVEQSFRPVPGTVLDQVTLGDERISPQAARQALELVGLRDTVDALEQGADTPFRPGLFSQGQLQLLSIARAVAAQPRLLLLDEITAHLDAATEETVLHALRCAGKGRTVLSISHRLYRPGEGRLVQLDHGCPET